MTVSSATSKVQYNGNGSTTVFAYTFKVFNQNDLTVIVRSATGIETVKTITTHYTVSGVGSAGGGNITMLTAPASGETLTVLREQDLVQELDLVENDPFPAQSLEDALDKLTFTVQQHSEEIDRSIKASRTNTIGSTEFTVLASDRANKVFAFDSAGELAVTQELGTFRGNWGTATAFKQRDLIKDTSNNNIYICVTAHTSTGSQPISSNADVAKWTLIVDAASATTSASAASSSASAAATSATNASNSATASAGSASAASTSATNASNSASAASTSETNAAASAAAAAASYDSFDDRYLGPKSSNPSVDNDGNALLTGALYFNTVSNEMRIWNGTAWQSVAAVVASLSVTGVASFADGSAAAPSITNTGDLNAGLFFPAADTVAVSTAGTERMRVDSSGNVGIGTTSPTASLDVLTQVTGALGISLRGRSSDNVSDFSLKSNDAATVYGQIQGRSTDLRLQTGTALPITFFTNTTERMRIDSAGNVGIGTTSPTGRLTVADGATAVLTLRATSAIDTAGRVIGTINFQEPEGIGDGTLAIEASINALRVGSDSFNSGGDLNFSTRPFNGSLTERMRIDASGNVGIGTTSPATQLDISSGSTATLRLSNSDTILTLDQITGEISFSQADVSASGAGITGRIGMRSAVRADTGSYAGTAADMAFFVSGSATGQANDNAPVEAFTIKSNGELITGNGDISATPKAAIFRGTNASGTDIAAANLTIQGGRGTGTGAGGALLFSTAAAGTTGSTLNATTERMRISSTGVVGIGVTPSAWDSALSVLQLGGAGFVRGDASTGEIGSNAYFNGTSFVYTTTAQASRYRQSSSIHAWFNAPIGTAGTAVTFTQAMTLDADGDLGIGTTSPSEKLDVVGKGVFTSNADILTLKYASDAGSARIAWKNVAGTTLWDIVGGMVRVQDEFAIRRAGTSVVYLDNVGNMGIGNSVPVAKLHVTGASITTGVVYKAQPAQTSKAAAATLTIAELLTGIVQYTGAAATLTLPTGTSIEGGLPATFPTDMSFDVSFINTGAGLLTIGANGNTTVGTITVATLTSAMLRFRKTAANTYTVYRIS